MYGLPFRTYLGLVYKLRHQQNRFHGFFKFLLGTAEISRGGEDITPVPDNDGAYSLELTAGEDYTVAVTVSEGTNGNGYLKIITPDEANTYYAGPINNQYAVQSFTVVVRPTVSGVYTFAPRWGTHNGGYNIQGNHLDDDGNLVAYSLT